MKVKIAMAVLMVLMISAALNFYGFCFKQLRFFPVSERIELAAQRMYESTRGGGTARLLNKKNFPIQRSYENFEEFMARNPGCCVVDGRIFRGLEGQGVEVLDDFIWRCFGMRAVRVIGKFKELVPSEPDGEIKWQDSGTTIDVGNCGRTATSF